MDSGRGSFSKTCTLCRKTFVQPSTFTLHQRTCSKTKKRLYEALAKAKETWKVKKKRRITTVENDNALLPLLVDPTDSAVEGMEMIKDSQVIAVRSLLISAVNWPLLICCRFSLQVSSINRTHCHHRRLLQLKGAGLR